MIGSLLIANRGEIARRIIRTARRLHIRTVAVYSDADAGLPFVREADVAVRIGPAPVRASYLLGEKMLEAARETGAEAVHPGYGFLSENAEFAEAVQAAGLVWVGAPPLAIRAMGLKDAAKQLMLQAGVPVTPGYLGEDQSEARLAVEAEAIGWPVLIKAVAGGGGKGMRRVNEKAQFADALESCQREADASFGNSHVLIEKHVLDPRHIEVQVFGDTLGQVVHLFERDCSLQRRHQKVIEEAPAPGMDASTRAAVCDAAVRAAKAVGYVGAGTIEFIADASEGLRADRIYFMEMNTRLQVEHGVTEAITGQDLVEWQLRIASGESLPLRQDKLEINGWAMEARLYAENPATGFLPSIGQLRRLRLPSDIRVDSGVEEGNEVSPFYDPMIAKLISHAATRAEAASRLARACSSIEVWPVKTNAAFLARAASSKEFRAGNVDTGFIERHAADLVPSSIPSEKTISAAAAALLPAEKDGPRSALRGFRLNAEADYRVAVEIAGYRYFVERVTAGTAADVDGESVLFMDGESWVFRAPVADDEVQEGAASDEKVLAVMPGQIIHIAVAVGDVVERGQRLLVIEAMKTEMTINAPLAGTVVELNAEYGRQVTEGTLLVRVQKGD